MTALQAVARRQPLASLPFILYRLHYFISIKKQKYPELFKVTGYYHLQWYNGYFNYFPIDQPRPILYLASQHSTNMNDCAGCYDGLCSVSCLGFYWTRLLVSSLLLLAWTRLNIVITGLQFDIKIISFWLMINKAPRCLISI